MGNSNSLGRWFVTTRTMAKVKICAICGSIKSALITNVSDLCPNTHMP